MIAVLAFSQIGEMDGVFRMKVKGYSPALPTVNFKDFGKCSDKFNTEFLQIRLTGLSEYFRIVCTSRAAIFVSKAAAGAFLRFIAPLQYGDEKSQGFILPFKLDII